MGGGRRRACPRRTPGQGLALHRQARPAGRGRRGRAAQAGEGAAGQAPGQAGQPSRTPPPGDRLGSGAPLGDGREGGRSLEPRGSPGATRSAHEPGGPHFGGGCAFEGPPRCAGAGRSRGRGPGGPGLDHRRRVAGPARLEDGADAVVVESPRVRRRRGWPLGGPAAGSGPPAAGRGGTLEVPGGAPGDRGRPEGPRLPEDGPGADEAAGRGASGPGAPEAPGVRGGPRGSHERRGTAGRGQPGALRDRGQRSANARGGCVGCCGPRAAAALVHVGGGGGHAQRDQLAARQHGSPGGGWRSGGAESSPGAAGRGRLAATERPGDPRAASLVPSRGPHRGRGLSHRGSGAPGGPGRGEGRIGETPQCWPRGRCDPVEARERQLGCGLRRGRGGEARHGSTSWLPAPFGGPRYPAPGPRCRGRRGCGDPSPGLAPRLSSRCADEDAGGGRPGRSSPPGSPVRPPTRGAREVPWVTPACRGALPGRRGAPPGASPLPGVGPDRRHPCGLEGPWCRGLRRSPLPGRGYRPGARGAARAGRVGSGLGDPRPGEGPRGAWSHSGSEPRAFRRWGPGGAGPGRGGSSQHGRPGPGRGAGLGAARSHPGVPVRRRRSRSREGPRHGLCPPRPRPRLVASGGHRRRPPRKLPGAVGHAPGGPAGPDAPATRAGVGVDRGAVDARSPPAGRPAAPRGGTLERARGRAA